MNKIDAFLLLGSGYTCGCASFAGFGAHALKDKIPAIKKWPLLWIIISIANGLILGFTTIFLFVFFTIGDKPGYPDFFARAVLFLIGLSFGMFLVINFFRKQQLPR